MVDEVNSYAQQIQTCVVDLQPFKMAESFGTCGLHMDCNEALKLFFQLEELCCIVTLSALPQTKTFVYDSESGSNGNKSTTILPDVMHCAETAPIKKLVVCLQQCGLNFLSEYLTNKYSPGNKVDTNIRLIGEDTTKLFQNWPNTVFSDITLSREHKMHVVITCCYGHLLRCMSVLYSQWL